MSRVNAVMCSLTICVALLPSGADAKSRDAAAWAAHLADEYTTTADVTYLTAGNIDLKLDVHAPRGLTAPNSVLIYYHGGGWGGGTRASAAFRILPYLEMGFTVVNVDYRVGRMALAPAAVEDCRCALQWVASNSERHKFDVNKIVLTGDSAGSHLALISGMLTPASGLDRLCPPSAPGTASSSAAGPKAAAIVNWAGATDVGDLLEGPNARTFAISWMGGQLDRAEIAKRVSPLTYVRPGQPAIMSIHGDADGVIPYGHATRLHAELSKHGVPNQLFTVPGGGHGGFDREQDERIYAAIREFLGKLNLIPGSG